MYYGIFVSYPAELCYPMPPENGKGSPKECVSTNATADLHTYFLRRFAINLPSYLKKNHTSTSIYDTIFCFEDHPAEGDGTRTGVVFLCEKMGWGDQLFGHTLPTCSLNTALPPFFLPR